MIKVVKFCKKCGNIMLPKDGKWVCTVCHFEMEMEKEGETFVLKERIESKKKEIAVIENVNTLPTTKVECPQCGNLEAFWWLQQTRCADEPETRFYRCTKCGHTWREYD